MNHRVTLPERVVLPRLSDVMDQTLRLLRDSPEGMELAYMVLDFSDAFKQLRVAQDEQRFLSGAWSQGWFLYQTVMFGIASGPLVWGRVAAALMRFGQSVLQKDGCLACFVDDPIMPAVGIGDGSISKQMKVALLWTALGFNMAWSKCQTGRTVNWIGAQISVSTLKQEVEITIANDKRDKLAQLADNLLAHVAVGRKPLRRFVGLAQWMAGLLPQLRPFCERLWAALSSKGKDHGHVWRDQVKVAVSWLVAFVQERHYPLKRVLSAKPPQTRAVLFFDACPSGGGALLYLLPFGELPDPSVVQHTEVPTHFTCARWSPASERAASALIGDPGSQARWEAFAMVSAIFYVGNFVVWPTG